MDNLVITISWEWALGIFLTCSASLIALAWRTSARFTALEVSVDWIKKILQDMKTNSDNNASGTPAFASHSPVNLTELGIEWLEESGLKQYIDAHPEVFLAMCETKKQANPYEIQTELFEFFDGVHFDDVFEDALQTFIFKKGTTMDVMRRVGAIYLRNQCLSRFGMDKEDIDKHDPEKLGNRK